METGDANLTPSPGDQNSTSNYLKPDEKSSESRQNETTDSDGSIDQTGIATHPAPTTAAVAGSSDSEIAPSTDDSLVFEPPDLAKSLLLEGTKKLASELSESYSDDLNLKWDDEESIHTDPSKKDGTDSTDNTLQALTDKTSVEKVKEVSKGDTESSNSIGDLILPASSLTEDPISEGAIDNKNKEEMTPSKVKKELRLDSTDVLTEFDEDIKKTESKVNKPHEGDGEMSLDDVIASLDKEINNSDQGPTNTENTEKDLKEKTSNIKADTDIAKVTQKLDKIVVPIKAETNTETLPSEDINIKDAVGTTIKEGTDKSADQTKSVEHSDETNKSAFHEMDTTPIDADSGAEKTKEIDTSSVQKSDELAKDPEPMEVSDANPNEVKEVMDIDEPTSGVTTGSNDSKTDGENVLSTKLGTQGNCLKDTDIFKRTEVDKNNELVAVEKITDEIPSEVLTNDILESKPIEVEPTPCAKEAIVTSLEKTITSNESPQDDEKTEQISEITQDLKEQNTADKTRSQETLSNIATTVHEAQTLTIEESVESIKNKTLGSEVTATMDEPEPMSLDIEENIISPSKSFIESNQNEQAIDDIPKTSDTTFKTKDNDTERLVSYKDSEANELLKDIAEHTNETATQEVSLSLEKSEETAKLEGEAFEKTDNTEITQKSDGTEQVPMEPKTSVNIHTENESTAAETLKESIEENLSEPMSITESGECIEKDLKTTETLPKTHQNVFASDDIIKKADIQPSKFATETVKSENEALTSENLPKSVENIPDSAEIDTKSPGLPNLLEKEKVTSEIIPESSEILASSTENITKMPQHIPSTLENKDDSAKNKTNSNKSIDISAENVLNSTANVATTAENIHSTSETTPTSSENIPKSAENIPKSFENLPTPSESAPVTSKTISLTSNTQNSEIQPVISEFQPLISGNQPSISENLDPISKSIPSTIENKQSTTNIDTKTSENTPSTTETSDPMDPDASDEIPEVTDSLGLLAESFRPMDDQDMDEEPVDDDEDVEDDDDDDDDNQTTLEHSEDSNNAQSSETDQPKELIEATDSLIETEAAIDVPMESCEETLDSNLTEKVIKTPDIATVLIVQPNKEIIESEKKKMGTPNENYTLLKHLLETDNKSAEVKKTVEESPTKTKKLEISQPKVFMNFVDLEESSSEDDIQVQEVNKDITTNQNKKAEEKMSPQKEEQVTVNIPKEIDVTSTAVGSPSSIVSKEVELEISGIPKPVVAKLPRLNTDDISIKTAKDSEPNLVIPETKMETEKMTKAQAENELNQEIFNLDSDEDKEKEEAEKTKLDEKPKEADRCINPLCECDHETTPKMMADPAILRFYKVKKSSKKKKEPAMVCVICANEVALRMESLVEGVKSLKPLLELDIHKSVQELVEISDSDTDSDGEGKEVIGRDAAKFLENELENMINSTWKKYNLDERMQTAKEKIETEVDELERETKEINDMLNECQVATDNLRKQFYSNFTRRISTVKPFVIVDTPTVKYSHLVEEEDVLPAPLNRSVKRTKSLVDEPPSKKTAGAWFSPNKEQSQTAMDSKDDDNTEVRVVKLSVESAPSGLPPAGELLRPPVKNGDMVLAARNLLSNWTRARVEFVLPKLTGTPFTQCRVRFEHKVKAQVKVLQCKHIAYFEPANVRLTIGTRIIAIFKDPTNPQKRDMFYSGVIAEVPNPVNKYRYLVFFDDGYAQYVTHENTRVVTESSTLVWDEVGPLSREFVRNYLLAYPERPMVRLHAGQKLKTEWNGKWWLSKVMEVDASLVHVHFEADNRYEWIYRGSTRLAPLYLELQAAERHRARALHRSAGSKARVNMPYVEYTRTDETSKEDAERERREHEQEEIRRQRAVAKKSTSAPNQPMVPADTAVMSRVVYYTPKAAVKPYKMSPHTCSPKCRRTDVLPLKELRTYNPLARPLLSGWERQIVRFRFRREIMYRAPCGRRLRSMEELHQYLMTTQSDMSVDLFDFGVNTHCLAEFVLNRCLVSKKDLSHGKENVPVPCVNYYDTSLPEFCSYNTERTPTAGVPLNLDPEFLCGCDCTDDCRDKSKCACWKLTLAGARTIGMEDDVGYHYRRLQEPVPSGIYECNSRCKCKSTCLNRVAQHPLQLKLQVFKTQNRGWGIRALNDVPKGGFLCIYAGNLLTDATANLDGLNEGDEYLAELDYIEVVEQMKEGFEADIPEKDKELDRKSSSKSSSASSESEEEEEEEEREKNEDGDFKPDIEPGIALFSKRLRRRNKKKEGEENTQKEKAKPQDDCITISDDEELREPSRFMAQAGMGANQFISKYKSVRELFGEDEACYIMDAKVQGNIGRYLNHSCTPNVFVQNVFVDTHDPRFPWVAFFALAHVKAGTELTWNYNYDIGSVPGKVLYCYCGAPNCRGRLL